jgi:small subunit ribosomal protein S13
MARIAGITLPENKKIDIGLTTIYGVGRRNVDEILKKAAVDPDKRVTSLTADEITRLTKAVASFPVEGGLKKQIAENIKRLKVINTYRGARHNQGLPARGQRTRSNARTKRGKRKTIGAMRKKDLAKQETQKKTKEEKAK